MAGRKITTIKTKLKVVTSKGKSVTGPGGKLSTMIVGQLNEFVATLSTKLDKLYQEQFGTTTTLSEWKTPAVAESKIKNSTMRQSAAGSKKATKELLNLYADAWKRKYAKVRSLYRSKSPDYKDRDWYKLKVRGKNRITPVHSHKTFQYVEWGLATGHFRDNIYKQLRAGGGDAINMQNILQATGFSINYQAASLKTGRSKDDHYLEYAKMLVSLGVIKSPEDMSTLLPKDASAIKKKLKTLISKGFIEEARKIIEKQFVLIE